MPLSKKAIEKIYDIRKKLEITYKAAMNEEQKKRVYASLKQIEEIIKNIEDGIDFNLKDLNLFSNELINIEQEEIIPENPSTDRVNYLAKIESLKISDANKDPEVDQIYSFLIYFDKHFSSPLSSTYLKLEYDLSKKRETYLNHYDNIKKIMKEFTDDVNLLKDLKMKDQLEQFKIRLLNQKKHLLVKLSEFLHELKEFFEIIIHGFKSGTNTIFNPNEKFIYRHKTQERTDFNNMTMIKIIEEALLFTQDFLEILRIPDFRKI